MYDEKSCGAVVYIKDGGMRRYLLIKNREGNIGFPKGHTEPGESEEDTARREIFEETGLSAELTRDFRREYGYTLKNGRRKLGVYFLAEAKSTHVTPQEGEIRGWWLDKYGEAAERLTYDSDRTILEEADKHLEGKKGG